MASKDENGSDRRRDPGNRKGHEPLQLFKPHFDDSFDVKDEDDEAGLLFPPDEPFLCGSMPMTESNFLAWLVRGTKYNRAAKRARSDNLHPHQSSRFLDKKCDPEIFKERRREYDERRREMRRLATLVESGGAHVDEDMRLVPTTPRADGGINENNNNNNAGVINGNAFDNNDNDGFIQMDAQPHQNDNNDNNVGHAVGGGVLGDVDEEEEELRAAEREEREAADAISRAVQRYRRAGVPEHEFELIAVPQNENDAVNLTFRRICFAVLAVATAFVCIMLQTLPLFDTATVATPNFDKLMYELLHVRDFEIHARCCTGLNRMERSWEETLAGIWHWRRRKINCADGVLHIPALHVLSNTYISSLPESAKVYTPYVNGFNISWFHSCHIPSLVENRTALACYPGSQKLSVDNDVVLLVGGTCEEPLSSKSDGKKFPRCFRGVHDGIVTSDEVDDVLKMAGNLISAGGNHLEIHHDVSPLIEQVPSVTAKLEGLLRRQYDTPPVRPVAFRVSVTLPMGSSILSLHHYTSKASLLVRALNKTTYAQWDESIRQQNELASFSLPPPFTAKPFRDPCVLLSDLEASDDFVYHTSVFLSDGAGEHYTGGAALYVDNHGANSNPRRKVRRGISIDGSIGRIVVSTGGDENRRCRLPTRSGIRAVLQIWWGCHL